MSAIAQYVLYFVASVVPLWLLLLYWGFSAGLASAVPYFALLAYLELLLVAAGLSLYLEKPGALAAVVGGAVGLAWPVAGILAGDAPLVGALVVAILLLAVTADGVVRLVRQRGTPWLQLRAGPSIPVRVGLTALPFGLVGSAVNIRAVLYLVLQGPPRWW